MNLSPEQYPALEPPIDIPGTVGDEEFQKLLPKTEEGRRAYDETIARLARRDGGIAFPLELKDQNN